MRCGSIVLACVGLAATAVASHLTPLALLEAPRPGDSLASPDGRHAVIAVAEHNVTRGTGLSSIWSVAIPAAGKGSAASKGAVEVVRNASSALWLSNTTLVTLRGSTLYAKSTLRNTWSDAGFKGVRIGTLPAEPSSWRVLLHDRGATIVFSAAVYDDGDLRNVETYEKSAEGQEWEHAKIYDTTFVRHWDKWLRPGKRTQLFAIDLKKRGKGRKERWSFAGGERPLMQGTGLEAPVAPFGDEKDYSLGLAPDGTPYAAFTAKDPSVNPAWHTRQQIYTVPLAGTSRPQQISPGGQGATSSPAISPCGSKVAYLQMARDGFEADVRRIKITTLASNETVTLLSTWDRSPTQVAWSADGQTLLIVVEEYEQEKLLSLPLTDLSSPSSQSGETLMPLVRDGGVSSVQPLRDGRTLLTRSSLRGPNEIYTASAGQDPVQLTDFKGASRALAGVDLGPMPRRFNYVGMEGREAYGWVVPPPGYSEDKTYPLLTLIHGGPEGAWTNSWSTRWNPSVFAAAGFFVITLDPAGSTGFGQKYQEGILGAWATRAFFDIRAGVRHILDTHPNLDQERVVAAGASFGGYMINLINGRNQDKLFKGLVCHDGVFSTLSTWYATDELYFPEFEFGGVPWEARAAYLEASPEQYTDRWATPQLTIAGGKDFRLPESEGLSVFNVLQRRGVPSKLLYFPDENHWVMTPRNSLVWHREVLAWLLKYSSNASAPAPGDADAPAPAGLTFQ